MIMGRSCISMASQACLPMPGTPNTISRMSTPPRNQPKSMPSSVMMGLQALRMMWRHTTVRSGRPLARAAFT